MTDLRDRLQASLGESYRLERALGGGGMSCVFVAHDLRLGREVVVKVLSPDLAAGVSNDRFHREILVAAQLQHPHIVPVLAAGDMDGLPYFIMGFIAGESLRRRLDGGKSMPVDEAVAALRDVAKALAYAHEHGVVHRDIKPDNVLITGGSAVVADFGIAKALSSSRMLHDNESLTTVGSSLGTPAYMAPEQVAGDPMADHRIDIYAFGVTAYELLAGATPFHGRPPRAMLSAHLAVPPPPLQKAAPDVPFALAELVMKCLAKDPGDRPQTAHELVRALEHIDTSGDLRVSPWPAARASRRRTAAIITAAVIAVLAGGSLLWKRFVNERPAPNEGLVAVVPFRVASADPSMRYLREGMLDLLAAKLTGEGGMRASDPRQLLDAWRGAGGSDGSELSRESALSLARRFGAGRLLLGDVVGTPNRIVLSASLLASVGGDSLAKVSVEGPPDSLAWLVDRLASRLLTETSPEGASRLASLTTTSLPALRAYLDGQAKLRRVEIVGAADDFERALETDSTFALAALALRVSSGWYGDAGRQERGLGIAWRERTRLAPRDRALLDALAGPRYPEPPSAPELLAARERYLALAPDRADAWYLFGDLAFHDGWVLNVPNSDERAFESFKRASEIDSTYVVGYLHALPLALKVGDTVAARRFERLRLVSDTARRWLVVQRWHRAWLTGDSIRARAIADSIDLSQYLGDMLEIAVFSGTGTPDASRAIDSALRKAPNDPQRRFLSRLAHDFNIIAGRPAAALRYLVASADSAGDVNVPVLEVRDAMIADGDTSAAKVGGRLLRKLEIGPLAGDSVKRGQQRAATRVLEQWRLSRGDTTQTRRSLDRLRTITRGLTGTRKIDADVEISAIEAMHADLTHSRNVRAIAIRLDSLLRVVDYPGTNAGRASFANIVVARLLEKSGDVKSALAAIRRRPDVWAPSNPYVATQLREQGRLAALAGEREEAIRVYRHFLALRGNVEPALQPQVDAVRRQLNQLVKMSVGR